MRQSVFCILLGILRSSGVEDTGINCSNKKGSTIRTAGHSTSSENPNTRWWLPYEHRVDAIMRDENTRIVLRGLMTLLKEILGNQFAPVHALGFVNECLKSHGRPTVVYKTVYDLYKKMFGGEGSGRQERTRTPKKLPFKETDPNPLKRKHEEAPSEPQNWNNLEPLESDVLELFPELADLEYKFESSDEIAPMSWNDVFPVKLDDDVSDVIKSPWDAFEPIIDDYFL